VLLYQWPSVNSVNGVINIGLIWRPAQALFITRSPSRTRIYSKTVTLKCKLWVTEGRWKRYHSTDHIWLAISRVIWRCDLEMWVIGHSRSLKMIPFESLGTVSYLPSIVTMAVSVAICDIFSVKEWPDLENRVRVCSRSLEMASFDKSHTSLNT